MSQWASFVGKQSGYMIVFIIIRLYYFFQIMEIITIKNSYDFQRGILMNY